MRSADESRRPGLGEDAEMIESGEHMRVRASADDKSNQFNRYRQGCQNRAQVRRLLGGIQPAPDCRAFVANAQA